jgi:hypothetical protein
MAKGKSSSGGKKVAVPQGGRPTTAGKVIGKGNKGRG